MVTAVLNDDIEALQTLIDTYNNKAKSLDLNAGDKTALHYAAKNHNYRIVEELVNAGADLSRQDELGNTVLHCMATYTTMDPDALPQYLRVCVLLQINSIIRLLYNNN